MGNKLKMAKGKTKYKIYKKERSRYDYFLWSNYNIQHLSYICKKI